VNHGTDRSQETVTGDAAPTGVANPRRTRIGADGAATTPQNVRRAARD
jgi:hypothetical protein